MSAALHDNGPVTYVASAEESATVTDLVEVLQRRGVEVPSRRPALVSEDGRRTELPQPIFDALRQIAAALSQGHGVTVAPHDALLTTQEAADVLGISRPTLVRMLDEGSIPHEMRGRHRRVALKAVTDYQRRARRERRQILDAMVTDGESSGLYDLTPLPIETTR